MINTCYFLPACVDMIDNYYTNVQQLIEIVQKGGKHVSI